MIPDILGKVCKSTTEAVSKGRNPRRQQVLSYIDNLGMIEVKVISKAKEC